MKTLKNISKYTCLAVFCILVSTSLRGQERNRPERKDRPERKERPDKKGYSIEQAISERAQLHTIAFSGLAFITGSYGANTFFPPGKVADFFGFQYMRDIDKNEMGHNTNFLTRVSSNVIRTLSEEQLQQLKNLANQQAPIYDEFAQKRLVLIKAFSDELAANIPSGKKALSKEEVIKFCASLYELDAELSYNRALVVGGIISAFDESQKAYLAKMKFDNSATWPDIPENLDKRSLSHRAHVAVMTYASELFSWYAGSVEADVYFCPERHGTYFGGFYLKDYPAMGNPKYFISTALTGDKGEKFMNSLSAEQADWLKKITIEQEPLLKEIIQIRTDVSTELRKAMKNGTPDKAKVFKLIKRYGEIDGEMSYNYASCFAKIGKSLTSAQKEKLTAIRNLDVLPKGAYEFSDPIDIPKKLDCQFLFK